MRRRLAGLLVILTTCMLLLFALVFAVLERSSNGTLGDHEQIELDSSASRARGRAVYDRERCFSCHSIGGEGGRRSPLDGVGARVDEATIRKWIISPTSIKPAVRKPSYSHLTDEELESLVFYLTSLRDEGQ